MGSENTPQQLQHEPVLLEDVLTYLAPKQGETYLDLTAGYGGHARAIMERVGGAAKAALVERDDMAVAALQPLVTAGAALRHTDFATAARQFAEEGRQFDIILADLGVSSPQFDRPERGFSLRLDGPLDMRMDRREGQKADELVNELSEDELRQLIRRLGEEPMAKRIAKAIVEARPIERTLDLQRVISRAVGPKKATDASVRTFQALRIAVNRELDLLADMLELLPGLLSSGGRVAIISFHSLEDRLVKRLFQEEARAGYEARLRLLTKKPIRGDTNDANNPRARSAKLRAAAKIKNT